MNKLAILLCVVSTSVVAQDYSQVISDRQNAFEQIEELTESVEFMLDGDDSDWEQLTENGKQLTDNAQFLLTAFPEGSQEGSKAKAAVWAKPDKFNGLMKDLNTGLDEFYQGAVTQDAARAEAGLEQAMGTCKSCHRSYKARR